MYEDILLNAYAYIRENKSFVMWNNLKSSRIYTGINCTEVDWVIAFSV